LLSTVRRLFIAALLCGPLLLAWAPASSGAPFVPPSGPRLAVGASGGPTPDERLLSMGPDGEDLQLVARTGGSGWGPEFRHPVWNAAGTELAFFGVGLTAGVVELVGADGSGPRALRTSEDLGAATGSLVLGEPVFDPGTGQIIVARVHTASGKGLLGEESGRLETGGPVRTEFWELPVDGSKGRRLSTRTLGGDRAMVPYPSSISADGTIVATAHTRHGWGVVTIDPRSGVSRTVVRTTAEWEGELDPAISPDGTQIAYKVDVPKIGDRGTSIGNRGGDLMVVPTAGGKPRRLARVKGLIGWPSWDPSGSRIAFTAFNDTPATISTTGGGGMGSSVMEINADGSCLTRVYGVPKGAVQGAAWQPGADRGAGPISC
jgi:WD40-like Beta Propeller Repeat